MTEVTAISGDAWCLTEDVRDRIRLKVGQDNPDWETEIKEATDSVQSMWSDATGKAVGSSDMPTSDSDLDNLLRQATAYMAASEGHLKYSQNVRGGNEDGQRHVFLEDKAQDKFDQWQTRAELDPEDADDPDKPGTDIQARTGSLDPFGGD
jgi:hypothetical protein